MKSLLTILTIVFLFQACEAPINHEQDSSDAVEETTTAKQKTEETQYITLVDHLRIRKEPDLKAKVVQTIDEGVVLTFLGEKSENTERIKLRGKAVQAPWFKVRTAEGKIGWAFGGALNSLLDEELLGLEAVRVKEISPKEVTELIGLGVSDGSIESYAGKYQYYPEGEEKLLHGKFKFIGKYYVKDYDLYVVETYTGMFNRGTKNGVFRNEIDGIEGHSVAELTFIDGKCTLMTLEGGSEGEDFNEREENPADCVF